MMKNYGGAVVFFLILGAALGTEHYTDYGDNADRDMENLREFYRLLVRRSSIANNVGAPISIDDNIGSLSSMNSPYEHLMIRKSQRSPSLRLRFGRSDPAMLPASLLLRSESSGTRFEDN